MNLINVLLFVLFTGFVFSQPQPSVDFFKADIDILPDPEYKRINGQVTYLFKVLHKTDSVFLDAKNMDFSSVLLNGKKVRHANTKEKIVFYKKLKSDQTYKLTLTYSTIPEQTVYFLGWEDSIPDNNQIWTQGQGKYTSHWLPSFDDMTEKLEYDLDISFDKTYEVIANGALVATKELDGIKKWSFDMDSPMSSYLLAFAIGDYRKKEVVSSTGVPISLYFYPSDSAMVEPTYRYTTAIFDFLEKEIGVPYPWQNYKEVPVRDFLYAGMENTGTAIFSDSYVMDSIAFVDRNFVNVNAHEMAHQWFGMQVEAANVQGQLMILETLSQYAAMMVLKQAYSEEKVQQFLELQRDRYIEGKRRGGLQEPSLALVENQDYIYYAKGAINMYTLQEKIGEEKVNTALKRFLEDWNTIDGKLKMHTNNYATSKELLDYFRDVTPSNQKHIITDLFESVDELAIK